ncbi:hypothetical protein Plhal703r1_c10g0052391 [Plasmopara halstedii]
MRIDHTININEIKPVEAHTDIWSAINLSLGPDSKLSEASFMGLKIKKDYHQFTGIERPILGTGVCDENIYVFADTFTICARGHSESSRAAATPPLSKSIRFPILIGKPNQMYNYWHLYSIASIPMLLQVTLASNYVIIFMIDLMRYTAV